MEPVDGSLLFDFFAYDPLFRGGVRIASGDINRNGTPDIITGPGPSGGPHVRVFEGSEPQRGGLGRSIPGPWGSFLAYSEDNQGGIFVAANNTGNPGDPLILTGSEQRIGTGPSVAIFQTPGQISNFQLPNFSGARVATLDFNRDGVNDYFLTTGPGRSGQVFLYSGDPLDTPFPNGLPFGRQLATLTPFGDLFQGGIFVAGSIPLKNHPLISGDETFIPGTAPRIVQTQTISQELESHWEIESHES